MKQTHKLGILIIVVVAAIGSGAWYVNTSNDQKLQNEVINKVQVVTPTAQLQAIKDKPVDLSLTNHQSGLVQVTIPGVANTPQPVAPGATVKLSPTPTTPGTYPIIETGTMTNTNSIEGGTVPVEYEVGHVVVSN